jgi:hypothetical protein
VRNDLDPVDRALESLGGRQWPGYQPNTQLESKLMRSFDTQKTASFVARHRVLVPALALLLVASVGFAAAGGIELVRSWFITVTVDGVTTTHEVVPNPDGSATVTIPLPPAEGEQRIVEMSIESGAADFPEGTKTVSVALSAGGDEAEVTITPDANEPE